jgi:hypothetical protein
LLLFIRGIRGREVSTSQPFETFPFFAVEIAQSFWLVV